MPPRSMRSLLRRRIAPFLGMQGIDEDEPGDVLRMRARERADDEAAEGMSDQDIRRRHVSAVEKMSQLADERRHRARARRRLAPRKPGAIVAAHARGARDDRLHAAPRQRRCGDARFENHGGRAGAGTSIVKPVTAGQAELRRERRTCAGRAPHRRPDRACQPARHIRAATITIVQPISHNAQKPAKPV